MSYAPKTPAELLKFIGAPPSLIGFKYLQRALEICLEDPTAQFTLTNVYQQIAEETPNDGVHVLNARNVCRTIRGLIEATWASANQFVLQTVVGGIRIGKRGAPTNKDFIATCVMFLRDTGTESVRGSDR